MVKKNKKPSTARALLKAYAGKRNFARSPEPGVTQEKAASKNQETSSKAQHFVIHKHAASRLHYDLRIECEGVLRSWAVPKGPSMDPLENRLSVRVEDHPLRYQDFEGVIPKGNYGAGTIMVWDRGEYSLFEALPGETHDQTFNRQYRKGSLKLEFRGQKLRGRFTLVKIKKSSGDDWLLIKKRDEFASTEDILLQDESVHSGLSLDAISSGAPRPNVKKTASKAGKGLLKKLAPWLGGAKKQKIPEKILPMRAKKLAGTAREANREGWDSQAIPAGLLVLATIRRAELNGEVRVEIRTTTGLNLTPRCKNICSALENFPEDSVFVGVVSLQKPHDAFYLCDVLWFGKHRTADFALRQRLELLSQLPLSEPLRLLTGNKDAANTLWLRDLNAPYAFGASNDRWITMMASLASGKVAAPRSILTNPSKVFWPEERITKKDLHDYYLAMADVLLPYLQDRPQSLNRHPDGIAGKSFFQKEVAGSVPGWITTTNMPAYGGTKTVTYLICQDIETLLYIVNMGCIELNPWLSRVPTYTKPDYAVIDIDPGSLSFSDVMIGAKVIQALLEKIDARSFYKTSGSRGLHIYLPTDGTVEFSDCQKFAELVGAYLHQKLPAMTSVDRLPMMRRNKLYVDALQNRKGQTMAAVYSVRPRPGAPVSTPIAWKELTKKFDPLAFNLKTVRKRVEKLGDIWADLKAERNDILALSATIEPLLEK